MSMMQLWFIKIWTASLQFFFTDHVKVIEYVCFWSGDISTTTPTTSMVPIKPKLPLECTGQLFFSRSFMLLHNVCAHSNVGPWLYCSSLTALHCIGYVVSLTVWKILQSISIYKYDIILCNKIGHYRFTMLQFMLHTLSDSSFKCRLSMTKFHYKIVSRCNAYRTFVSTIVGIWID